MQSLELLFRIRQEGQAQMAALSRQVAALRSEVRQTNDALVLYDAHGRRIATTSTQLAQAAHQVGGAVGHMGGGLTAAVAKGSLLVSVLERAVIGLRSVIVESVKYAARTEQMVAVNDRLIRNVGLNVTAVRDLAASMQTMGLSQQAANEAIAKAIFAQMPLNRLLDLTRLAQDAARITGISTKEAFERLQHAIVTLQPEVARGVGVQVNFEQALRRGAAAAGKQVEHLSSLERITLATNEVLSKSDATFGSYIVSVGTAAGRLQSLSRHLEEARNALGGQFLSTMGRTVEMLTSLSKEAKEGSDAYAALAKHALSAASAMAAARLIPGGPIARTAGAVAAFGLAEWYQSTDPASDALTAARLQASEIDKARKILDQRARRGEIADQKAYLNEKKKLDDLEVTVREQFAEKMAAIVAKERAAWKPPTWNRPYGSRPDLDPPEGALRPPELRASYNIGLRTPITREEIQRIAARAQEPFDPNSLVPTKRFGDEGTTGTLNDAIKRAQERVDRIVQALSEQGLDPLSRLALDQAEALRDLTKMGATRQQLGRVAEAFRAREIELIGERLTPFEQQRRAEQNLALATPNLPALAGGLATSVGSIQVDPAANEAILQRFRDRSLASLHREMQYRERMIALLAGPGGERAAIEQIAQVREEAALREFQITKDRHALEERLDQNRKDRIIAIAELQKRQLEQYRETAGRVFDALTARGGSGGLRDFLAGQAKILERQIFVNASAGIFRQAGGMLGRVGAASGLGGLLAGTIFDPQNANPAEATLDNTRETRRNTDELRRLRITFQGGTTGGVPAGLSLLDSFRTGPTADQTLRMLGGALGREAAGSPGLARKLQDALQGSSPARGAQNLLAGLASPLSAGLFAGVRGGDYSIALGGGRATTASALGLTSTAGRIGNLVGSGALVGLGTLGVVSGIREGGARGATTAVGSALGVASAIPGPQQPILQAAALVAGLVRGMFGDPKDQRRRSLERDLEGRRFTEPEGAEYATDIYGRKVDSDFRGRLRAVPQINVTINAMDASTFRDFARSNPVAFSEAVTAAIQSGNGEDLVGTLRQTLT